MGSPSIALVTGASSGFGRLIAIEFARQGYYVIATMRNMNKQSDLIQHAKQNGVLQKIECLPLDVTDQHAIGHTVQHVIETHGRIDVLVNNAGIAIGGFTEEVAMEDWRMVLETNFFAVVSLTREVLPHMRAANSGKIINISSVSGRFGFPGYGSYAASKFAIEGFSESLRLEMLPYGIYVSLVEPGAYATEIWDKGFEYANKNGRDQSPYRKAYDKIVAYSKKMVNRARDPQEVAKVVVKIAESRYPNMRYLLGKGAYTTVWAKTLLPWKWLERIILTQLWRK